MAITDTLSSMNIPPKEFVDKCVTDILHNGFDGDNTCIHVIV